MNKEWNFVLGGLLVIIGILSGNWFLSPLFDANIGIFQKIFMAVIFLVINLWGLSLIFNSLTKK